MRTKTIILAALFSLVPAVPVMAADPAPAEGPAPAGAAPAAAPAAAGHHPHALRHFIAADKNGYRELLKLADDYDANHDGALDENEVALYKAGLVSHLEADLAGIADFKALDADGSGYITVDELADAGDQASDGAKKPLPVPGPKKEPAAKRMPGRLGQFLRDRRAEGSPEILLTARPAQPSSGLTAAGRTDMAMIMASDLGMSPDTASDPDMKQRVTERAALTLTSSGSSITIPAWTTAT